MECIFRIFSFHCGCCNRTGKANVATCVLAFISTMYTLPAPLQAVVTCQIAKKFPLLFHSKAYARLFLRMSDCLTSTRLTNFEISSANFKFFE